MIKTKASKRATERARARFGGLLHVQSFEASIPSPVLLNAAKSLDKVIKICVFPTFRLLEWVGVEVRERNWCVWAGCDASVIATCLTYSIMVQHHNSLVIWVP